MKHQLYLLAGSLFLFLIVVFTLDVLIGCVMRNEFDSQPITDDKFSLSRYFHDKATGDMIILGNSRALHHYDVKMIEDSIKEVGKVRNIAANHVGAIYDDCMLSQIVKRKVPKVVFFEYLEHYIDGSVNETGGIDGLKDYYYSDSRVRVALKKLDKYSPIKELSSIYRLTGLEGWNIVELLDYRVRGIQPTIYESKGYIPIEGKPIHHPQFSHKKYISPIIDPLELEYITHIFELSKEYNFKLYVVVSPTTLLTYPSNSITLKEICAKHGIPIIDNSYLPSITPDMFYDATHLTEEGAQKYTAYFISQIKKLDIGI